MFNIKLQQFDMLIVGAGGAGLTAAISAFDNVDGKINIAILSKVFANHSHTVAAQGGINASLGNVTTDHWQWHYYDTIKGSANLADSDAVEILCSKANEAILFLEHQGMVFSRDNFGKIEQRPYGGQSLNFGKDGLAYRACYAQDKTGHSLLHTLLQQVKKRHIPILEEILVIDLLIENNQCYGCLAIDFNQGELLVLTSKTLILATGGYSQIYHNNTSSSICTGDGTALVLKSGLFLQDMEFVQFHPTGLANSGILISEAARGEGAYLINKYGHRFMADYQPQTMELSCRDAISIAMACEMQKGNGCFSNKQSELTQKPDCLYLDLRHLNTEIIKKKLPNLLEITKKFGNIDVFNSPIPVSPAAHYTMGGIPCNIFGEVITGLFTVGESACVSVHGANRLGCNSLLELVVFGQIVGKKSAEVAVEKTDFVFYKNVAYKLATEKIAIFENLFIDRKNTENNLNNLKKQMQLNNEKSIGIFRNETLLKEGINQNILLYQQLKNHKISNKSLFWNNEINNYFETENLLLNSLAVAYSALQRIESRGSHYRFDFPNTNSEFLHHSLISIKNQNHQPIFIFNTKKVR
jgi:succinate dehydrogenase / fumarate reductase flavoprotein subunit